jgi:hypothetical protein
MYIYIYIFGTSTHARTADIFKFFFLWGPVLPVSGREPSRATHSVSVEPQRRKKSQGSVGELPQFHGKFVPFRSGNQSFVP